MYWYNALLVRGQAKATPCRRAFRALRQGPIDQRKSFGPFGLTYLPSASLVGCHFWGESLRSRRHDLRDLECRAETRPSPLVDQLINYFSLTQSPPTLCAVFTDSVYGRGETLVLLDRDLPPPVTSFLFVMACGPAMT